MQRLSRHLLEQIVALDDDAVVVADGNQEDHPLIYANAAFERLTGYSRDEVLGRNCRFLQGEATEQAALAEMREALADAKSCAVKVTNYRKDGSSFANELRLVPLRETRGGVRYYLGRMRAVDAPEVTSPAGKSPIPERTELAIKGVLAQRKFFEFARRDLGIAQRQKSPVTVLVFRIRHLDRYRKTFGGQAVESCLRMVGGRISGGLRRAGDLCTRLDDETFAALVNGQGEDEAVRFAERIAEQVRQMALHNPRAPEKFITVATSAAGVIPESEDTIEALLEAATQRL